MGAKKIIYIISDIDKSLAFEWLALHLRRKYDIKFILMGPKESALGQFLSQSSIPFYTVAYADHPRRISQLLAIFNILRKEKPDVIHTHLWNATLIGLLAGWMLNIPIRINTRHHATVHYNEHPAGLKWDKVCNWLATHIVAVSKSMEAVLRDWDKAEPSKIVSIPHGFELAYFDHVSHDRVQALQLKYKIPENAFPVIGVISRYTAWKGIQYVIPAFKSVLKKFPKAFLILANARGDFETEIKKSLSALPSDTFREVPFEHDLAAVYKLFDIFVHVPIDPYAEAFGQTYVEALASGVPSVFTLSGVAPEIVVDGSNAITVPFCNADEIANGIIKLTMDNHLRQTLVVNGRRAVKTFSIELMVGKLMAIYG